MIVHKIHHIIEETNHDLFMVGVFYVYELPSV